MSVGYIFFYTILLIHKIFTLGDTIANFLYLIVLEAYKYKFGRA